MRERLQLWRDSEPKMGKSRFGPCNAGTHSPEGQCSNDISKLSPSAIDYSVPTYTLSTGETLIKTLGRCNQSASVRVNGISTLFFPSTRRRPASQVAPPRMLSVLNLQPTPHAHCSRRSAQFPASTPYSRGSLSAVLAKSMPPPLPSSLHCQHTPSALGQPSRALSAFTPHTTSTTASSTSYACGPGQ